MVVLFSYLFYFIAASASPMQRRWLATRKNTDNKGQVHFAFQVSVVVALLSLLLPFFKPAVVLGNIWHIVGLAVLAGVFGASFFILSYTAQKYVEAGITTLVSNIYTPITIILATIFLNESLTSLQIFGTALLLVGVIIVSKKHRIGRFTFDKYFVMMLLSGIALGVCLVAERALQKETGFTAGTMISWWAQCLFLGIAVLSTKNRSAYSLKDVTITGSLRFFQSLSWVILIYVVSNLSLASAVTTFKVVIIFIAAALFLRERDDLGRKIIGSVVALAGLLLMK